ncbi:ly6/PLAUR domain-containing protein 2-like [Bufo bufo]|uniref:ly6/PLAUR domain-containing protein 2-like n=1 Tax=Bufo bufo TaxID=8384 RepID=UPI001ABE6FC7|nr:ly6/PLAUR domain-containing protein 2-like [Bufo bufo]
MKLLICIVLTIVSLELVCSLQCYICLTPTSSDQCLTKKNCTRSQNWCASTIYGPTTSGYPFTGSRYVVRSCAEKCQSTNPNYLGVDKAAFLLPRRSVQHG